MSDYFGEDWGAPVTEGGTRQPTPFGAPCLWCEEPIIHGESGTFQTVAHSGGASLQPIHKECSLRQVVGGAGHHLDHAFWCGFIGDPDGGMTKRASALWVWDHYQEIAS